MTYYYHSANFPDFQRIPENSQYVESIDAAFALLSQFDPNDFTINRSGYIHVFLTDEILPTSTVRYDYRYVNPSTLTSTIVASINAPTTELLPAGYLAHAGSYMVPMSKYQEILEKFVAYPPRQVKDIADEIGNIIQRI